MKAVSGVLGSSIMFAVLFTVGISYFLFINQGAYQSLQAGQRRIQLANQASGEQLSLIVGVTPEADPWGQTGDLSLRIANTGTVPVTVIDVFVTNPTAELERFLRLGATIRQPPVPGHDFVELADPDGNPFCLIDVDWPKNRNFWGDDWEYGKHD